MSVSSAVSVGVAPSSINLGTAERGETVSGSVYLTLDGLENRFLVRPTYQSTSSGTYELDLAANYSTETANRNDFRSWISFPTSGQPVDPSTSRSVGGTTVESEVPFNITVPNDAEPGWYVGKINVNPQISRNPGSGSLSIRAVARPTVMFRVPGEVRRSAEVVESRGFRTGDSLGTATVRLENTGTVSAHLSQGDVDIRGPDGLEINASDSGDVVLEPGETQTVPVSWETSSTLPAGNYEVQGTYNYMTGAVFVDQTVQITDFIQDVEISDPGDDQNSGLGETGSNTTWIILFVLVVLGVLLYSFDIDPVWIMSFLGVAGLAVLVLTTGLPIWILGLTVIAVVFVLYYL